MRPPSAALRRSVALIIGSGEEFLNPWAKVTAIRSRPIPAEQLALLGRVACRVIVRLNWHGTGAGPQSDMEWTVTFTIRDGRISGVEYCWD